MPRKKRRHTPKVITKNNLNTNFPLTPKRKVSFICDEKPITKIFSVSFDNEAKKKSGPKAGEGRYWLFPGVWGKTCWKSFFFLLSDIALLCGMENHFLFRFSSLPAFQKYTFEIQFWSKHIRKKYVKVNSWRHRRFFFFSCATSPLAWREYKSQSGGDKNHCKATREATNQQLAFGMITDEKKKNLF